MVEKKTPLWAMNRGKDTIGRRENIGELLLLAAFFLFCVKYIFDISSILRRNDLYNDALVVLTVSLPILKIVFFQRYSLRRLALTALVALPVGISCLLSGNYLFLNGFLFAIAMQDVDIDKVARLSFRVKTALIALHVVAYTFVYMTDPSSIRFVYRAGFGPPRHIFFMGHANLFTSYLIWACLDYIYINYKKLNVFRMVAIWLVNLVFYYYTGTYTGLLILALTTVLVTLDILGKGFFDKALTVTAKYGYLFIALMFAFLTAVYTRLDGRARIMWEAIDRFMTGRMWPGAYVHETHGFTILGQRLRVPPVFYWQGSWRDAFLPFDNYYLGNLYHFGVIHLVVIAAALIAVCGKMESRDKALIIAFSFYGIMQKEVVIVAVCFVLFIIGKYLYPMTKDRENGSTGENDDCETTEAPGGRGDPQKNT